MWRSTTNKLVPALTRASQTPLASCASVQEAQRCGLCTKPPQEPPKQTPAKDAKPPAKDATPPAAEAKAAPEAKAAEGGSAPPPPSGGSGIFGKLVGLTLLGGGATVGYSLYDENFRRQLEKNVPYSKEFLNAISSSLPEKKTPEEKRAKLVEDPSVADKGLARTIKPDTSVIQQPTQPAAKPLETPVLSQKEMEKIRVKKAYEAKQLEEAAENAALEEILNSTVGETVESVRIAIEAERAAAKATRMHNMDLKKAMEDTEAVDKTVLWESVTGAFEAKKERAEIAEKALDKARVDIEKLKEAIKEGRWNSVTKKNKVIRGADETLNQLVYDLKQASAEHDKAKTEFRLMQEYKNLVKKGKEQFKKELESIVPDVKIGKTSGKLSEDELNSLIAHAHRRIEQLQRQIAEQQALEQTRLEAALTRQQEEDEKLGDKRVQREQEKLKAQFEIEKEKLEVEFGVQQEHNMRAQLTRQAAAHSDHLAQVLKVQEAELYSKYETMLQEKLVLESKRLRDQISTWIARLRGIEQAVVNRADMEKQGRKAQELWLACQTLHNLIRDGKDGSRELGEAQLKPLSDELSAIKNAAGDHEFVSTVAEAFPEEAINNGVWTREALLDRFQKVNGICRRVAMIDETGGTLFQYFLSYLQAIFVFRQTKALCETDEVDPDSLTTFTILDNAARAIERDDFEQALRFMNQLKGEARKAANDWIHQARLHMESKQAADSLLAFASASGLGNLI